METLRHILQWAVPALICIFLFIGTFKESKKAKSFSVYNGIYSLLLFIIILAASAMTVAGVLCWVYVN